MFQGIAPNVWEVVLSSERSREIVNGLWGLDSYIHMLENLLREAREARALFQRMVPPATVASGGAWAGGEVDGGLGYLLPVGGMGRDVLREGIEEVSIGEVAGVPTAVVDSGVSESHLERVLREAGVTRRTRIVDVLRIVASANDGLVFLGDTAHLLVGMALSRSSVSNLSGYLIKQMQKSQEFEREGEWGSGVYRWLLFECEVGEGLRIDVPGVCADSGPGGGGVSLA